MNQYLVDERKNKKQREQQRTKMIQKNSKVEKIEERKRKKPNIGFEQTQFVVNGGVLCEMNNDLVFVL